MDITLNGTRDRTWWRRWPDWIGYVALLPIAGETLLSLGWFLGGTYPFAAPADPDATFGDHWLTHLDPHLVESGFLVGGAVLIVAILLMQQRVHGAIRRVLIPVGWTATTFLVLVLPGNEALNNLPGLNLIHPRFSGPTGHLLMLLYAGLALGAATLVYQRATRPSCVGCGRDGRPARWTRDRWARVGRVASYTAFVAPFGYAVIRLLWTMDVPVGTTQAFLDHLNAANPGNTTHLLEWTLAGMTIGGGTLCLGLTQRWGETWPRWMVGLAGRPVRPWLPVVLGFLGGETIFAFSTGLVPGLVRFLTGHTEYFPGTDVRTNFLSHLPEIGLLTWGAAAMVAAVAYRFRTRPPCRECGRDG